MHIPAVTRTIRFRLTVWYSSLLLVFGIAFVVALNVAVRLDSSRATDDLSGQYAGTFFPTQRVPGQAVKPIPVTITLNDAENQIYAQLQSENVTRLRTWSLLAVVGLAVASGVGGWVLSGMMLQPVRDITRVASEISATNLSKRINHQGPQDELWALSETFDSMIDRLEASFDRQRQFVQDASHELRTPLAAIRTNIEVMEMDPDVDVEEYRELIETVKSQTARLTRLSEDLLLLTSDNKDTLDKEPVRLGAVAREVVRQLLPLAANRGVHLAVEGDEQLTAESNGDLLYRCVFNLVDNAIKYSGQDTNVAVRVRREGNDARIDVADDGAGIPQDQLGRVFDRFYRVDRGRSRSQGGSGLGLAIVQDLVHALGGTVTVDSTVGRGSTFTIRLPLAQEAEPSRTQVSPAGGGQPSPSLS